MVVKKNTAFLALMAVLLLMLAGCGETFVPGYGPPVTGSGVLKTQELNYSNFDSIVVGSAFQVDVSRAVAFSVSITMDDNLFEHLRVDQHAGTLNIGLASNYTYIRTVKKAAITLPVLHRLELTGASKGNADGFSSSDRAEFNLSGASDLNIVGIKSGDTRFEISGASHASGDIEVADARFNVSGASTAELKGSAANLYLEVSGASNARLSELTVADANVNLSGASRASIDASGRLDAEVSGASTLNYVGNPTLGRINTSGGSTVNKK